MSKERSPAPEAADPDGGPSGTSGLRGVAAPGPTRAPLELGARIDGRYELTERIGAGGMGFVFGALDQKLQRDVALKIIRRELADNPGIAARFEREALTASQLTHPHVVVVHDFGATEDGLPYLVMERLRGQTLTRAIRSSGGLSPARAVAVAIDVTRALVAAHAASIVHRDLKPDNIMLTREGPAKVLDFGIAKILQSPGEALGDAALTHTGMMMGTPLYMSPEAIKKNDTVGPPSDLYALGTILFRAIAGRPPFEHDEPVVVLSMHLQQAPPRLRDARPDRDVPEALDALVWELLAKSPADRPTAPETLARLEQIAATLTAPAEPAAPASDEVIVLEDPTVVTPSPDAPTLATPPPSTPRPSTAPPSIPPAAPAPPPVAARPAPSRTPWIVAAVAGVLTLAAGAALVIALADDEPDMVATTLAPTAAGSGTLQPAEQPAEQPAGEAPAGEAPPIEETAPRELGDDAVAPADDTPALSPGDEVATDARDEVAPAPMPPPRAAPGGQGRLVLVTNVPAEVTVDGEARGTTPLDLRLDAGSHRVRLRADGVGLVLTIDVREGEVTRRTVTLRPRRGPTTTSTGLELPDRW